MGSTSCHLHVSWAEPDGLEAGTAWRAGPRRSHPPLGGPSPASEGLPAVVVTQQSHLPWRDVLPPRQPPFVICSPSSSFPASPFPSPFLRTTQTLTWHTACTYSACAGLRAFSGVQPHQRPALCLTNVLEKGVSQRVSSGVR